VLPLLLLPFRRSNIDPLFRVRDTSGFQPGKLDEFLLLFPRIVAAGIPQSTLKSHLKSVSCHFVGRVFIVECDPRNRRSLRSTQQLKEINEAALGFVRVSD
jgi:hypothetical protein